MYCDVTGDRSFIDEDHFEMMKDGAIMANSGHFNVEINIPGAGKDVQKTKRRIRTYVDEYTLTGATVTFSCSVRAG